MKRRWDFHHDRRFFVTTLAVLMTWGPATAKDPQTSPKTATNPPIEVLRQQVVDRGLAYLAKEGQSDAGTFSDQVGPGVTALAITSALRNGQPLDDPMVADGLKALEGFVKPDGGIYGNGRLKNYETCVAMVCLAEANQKGQYNRLLKRAKEFVTGMQYGEGPRDPSDPWYGGVGYGGAGRPDLSNTGYLIEALRAVESGPDDPAIQRALAFVSRCQNLDSQYNDTQCLTSRSVYVSAIERSTDGSIKLQLTGTDGGDWAEWHPPGRFPESFIGGLAEQYQLASTTTIGNGWHLVRYR